MLSEIENDEFFSSLKYNASVKLLEKQYYSFAYDLLTQIGEEETIINNKFNRIPEFVQTKDFDEIDEILSLVDEEKIYNAAVQYYEDGEYETAYRLMKSISYKDSLERTLSIIKENLGVVQIGDTFFFGEYEQDNVSDNGKENIEWIVLAKNNNNNSLFVISKYALDCLPYNETFDEVTWETCSLRAWLNSTFQNIAFSDSEQQLIRTTTVSSYDVDPGNKTTDKLFLLSIKEIKRYFTSANDRKCIPTKYAIAQGAYICDASTESDDISCEWWSRTRGNFTKFVVFVSVNGNASDIGDYVNSIDNCVRPAMWISLE